MDDYLWEMTRGQVRRSPGSVPRRKAIGRVLMRFVLVFIGVLLITTGYQYAQWLRGPEEVKVLMSFMDFPDREAEQRAELLLREIFGLDGPFVPDLWPFDNESLWR